MRELDPFAFWANHASAIGGLGGEALSPDPRYCFHTTYTDVRPGPARFDLTLRKARASRGELALRIHAFRPDTGENASLVAGARLVVAVDDPRDLQISVPFSALRHVKYAFYGYFIEDSDIHVEGMAVSLQEFDGDVADQPEPPRSLLALSRRDHDVRPANALIHVVTPHITAPVSQDCTRAQMAELAVQWGPGQTCDDWAEALCLNALRAYGVIVPALEGVVVGTCSPRFSAALALSGFVVEAVAAHPPPPDSSGLFGDFLVWPEGLWPEPDPAARWDVVRAWFGRLKIGGLGVMTCRYHPDPAKTSSSHAVEGPLITRNEIGKWALRLIAEGYSVAPLAFSEPEDIYPEADGLVRFALVAQRL